MDFAVASLNAERIGVITSVFGYKTLSSYTFSWFIGTGLYLQIKLLPDDSSYCLQVNKTTAFYEEESVVQFGIERMFLTLNIYAGAMGCS